MSVDHGRAAVYAAEITAFEGTSYESVAPFEELLGLGRLVTSAAWWRGSEPLVVRLAAPQMTPATVLHELAHVLAGLDAGHGELFRRAHVDLVGYALGDEPATWLVEAYLGMGLRPGLRRWPSPPVRREAGGPIAL